MLNPNIEIKKWFVTNVGTATGLPVYDGMAPDNDLTEYIVLDGRTSSQEQGKSGYTNSNVIIVDIITKNANFGYKRSETISNLVLTAKWLDFNQLIRSKYHKFRRFKSFRQCI
jgi:hypothetical protein